jgi:hypothetical protein
VSSTIATVSLDLRPLVARWGEAARQAAIDQLQFDALKIVADAKRPGQWPVDTGRSRGLLFATEPFVNGDRVTIKILDAAPYASYIHQRGSATLVWDALILQPLQALSGRRFVQAIAARIRQIQQRAA